MTMTRTALLPTSRRHLVAVVWWWVLFTRTPFDVDAFSPEITTARSNGISIASAAPAAIRLSATTTTSSSPTTPMDDGSIIGSAGGNTQKWDAPSQHPFSSFSYPSPTVLLDEPTTNDRDEIMLDNMPWSDIQTWALIDNLPKFTVVIPSTTSIVGVNGVETKNTKSSRYAMWRTMAREIPELAGYPIPFLRKMHQRTLKQKKQQQQHQQRRHQSSGNHSSGESEEKYATPGVLPMVDNFEFTPNGGIRGRAYGLPGIADGTIIETPSLTSPEMTVPLGYVTTRGGEGQDENGNSNVVGFSYELGACATTTTPVPSSSSYYSLDNTERSAALAAAAARRLVAASGGRAGTAVGDVTTKMVVGLTEDDANQDLVYLGGATAMLLASATAVGMLSHHLTVNVFWV